MGGGISTDTHSMSMQNKNPNPNEIAVTQNVLCSTVPPPLEKSSNQQTARLKKAYSAEETANLTAELDQEYVAWLTDLEKQNESITKKFRDDLIASADRVYDRFSYIQGKPVCEDAKNVLLECYEANRTTPLHCSDEVKYFTECVKDYQMNYDRTQHMPRPHPKV